jgi:hypothetical protein
MLATLEQLPQAVEITCDVGKHKLRAHIAKMIAKIPSGGRPSTNNGKQDVEPESA